MSAHAGADTAAGVFASHAVDGAAVEPLHQRGDSERGRVGDEQVHVVGFAVVIDELGVDPSSISSADGPPCGPGVFPRGSRSSCATPGRESLTACTNATLGTSPNQALGGTAQAVPVEHQ